MDFTLNISRVSHYPTVIITDADYTDDLADSCCDGEILVQSLEKAAKEIGFCINDNKTECMTFNNVLKQVETLKYLGSEISSTERDVQSRIAKAWCASNKLSSIWNSNAKKNLKRNFFRTTLETVLLYSYTTWTMTKKIF